MNIFHLSTFSGSLFTCFQAVDFNAFDDVSKDTQEPEVSNKRVGFFEYPD
jgi:hypothetical protein